MRKLEYTTLNWCTRIDRCCEITEETMQGHSSDFYTYRCCCCNQKRKRNIIKELLNQLKEKNCEVEFFAIEGEGDKLNDYICSKTEEKSSGI